MHVSATALARELSFEDDYKSCILHKVVECRSCSAEISGTLQLVLNSFRQELCSHRLTHLMLESRSDRQSHACEGLVYKSVLHLPMDMASPGSHWHR